MIADMAGVPLYVVHTSCEDAHEAIRRARARALVVRHTLSGALDSIDSRIAVLAEATGEQQAATNALSRVADAAYAEASDGVRKGMLVGTLLRGEVLSRWQEFVGTGEFFKQVESAVSRVRDRITAAVKGQPPPGQQLGEALHSGVAALVTAEAAAAASQAAISRDQSIASPIACICFFM